MIQLTRNGLQCDSDLEALRAEFASLHCIRLPQLLSADIMRRISERMESENWIVKVYDGIAQKLLLDDRLALQLLHFVCNTPDFLSVVEQITSCGTLKRFHGRVYRMRSSSDYYDNWHDDIDDDIGRLIGMSINLGPRPYSGGVFQLRQNESEEVLRELPNVIASDAILFRISSELQHRVTPIQGAESKTAFAGWFDSNSPNLLASIRHHAVVATSATCVTGEAQMTCD